MGSQPAVLQHFRDEILNYARQHGYTVEENVIQYGLQFKIGIKGLSRTLVSIYQTGKYVIPARCPKLPGLEELLTNLADKTKISQLETLRWRSTDPQITDTVRQFLLDPSNQGIESENHSAQELWRITIRDGQEKIIVMANCAGTIEVGGQGNLKATQIIDRIGSMLGTPGINASAREVSAPNGTSMSALPIIEYPYIGSDESGKGDYFGPLVIAATLLDQNTAKILESHKVRDSKLIEDKEIKALAEIIRNRCLGNYRVLVITPLKYNQLFDKFKTEGKNSSSLLAWGHARVLEDLASTQPCPLAITDKFGDERLIQNRLDHRGIKLNLKQMVRAERFVAVAAASILARDRFVRYLEEKSKAADLTIPLGANQKVIEVGKIIYQRWGLQGLRKIAKLHFRTTQSIIEP